MTLSFNPRKLTFGVTWRAKPRGLWIDLPMITFFSKLGKECPHCHGQGGYSWSAGGSHKFDECETCNGTGIY